MSIYSIYTNRVCNLDTFVIGTPILNRCNFKEKQCTGMFISTIPFKVNIDSGSSFNEFTSNISTQFMQIFRHQKYPYQNILQDLRKINPHVPNLYDFLISYQNVRSDKQTNSVNYSSQWVSNGNISDSLNIHLYDMNDIGSLNIAYDYQINKYTSKDIENLHFRIIGIIEQILDNPSILLKDIHVLTSLELEEIKKYYTNTQVDFNFCDNILKQIEHNAKGHLNKIAIETATDSITYEELFKRINQLSNFLLDKGWHIIPGFVTIKSSDMEGILDRIDASIPEDIKEAESLLRRREEIQIEAQQRAERIIMDARNEAERILSESELLSQVHQEAEKIKEQVLAECQELRERTIEEAKNIKIKAEDEAIRTKEGAENYAEQILNNIENDLTQLHQIVKNGQLYLEKLKSTDSAASYGSSQEQYNDQNAEYEQNYSMQ